MSHLESTLELHLKAHKITGWEREYRFAAEHVGLGKGIRARLQEAGLKDWRFDFAWPELKLAVEVEGGGWSGGRHTRGKGFSDDLRKYDAAMNLGWTIYRCDGAMVKAGVALNTITVLLESIK
jgi:very-short-patch-repair endonuclease